MARKEIDIQSEIQDKQNQRRIEHNFEEIQYEANIFTTLEARPEQIEQNLMLEQVRRHQRLCY